MMRRAWLRWWYGGLHVRPAPTPLLTIETIEGTVTRWGRHERRGGTA